MAALKRAGCKTVFKDEGLSGATTKRPALTRCLKTLQDGDTLTVWKLDRLGCSLRDLITMLDDLRARGVKFRSLTEAIDTETPTGRAGGSERSMFGAGCNSLIAALPGGVRCHAEDFMGLFSAVIVVERDRLSKNLRGDLKLFRSVPGFFVGRRNTIRFQVFRAWSVTPKGLSCNGSVRRQAAGGGLG